MENLFLRYMGERMEHFSSKHTQTGPGITISRECGCPGNEIAEMLKNRLNQKMIKEGHQPIWKWVNKEILLKASHELKMNPGDVETFLKTKESGMLQDLANSFAETSYVKNARIKKVIFNVIRNMALEGHMIVVGRGGGSIAWDIPKSLHVYLEAPLSWKTDMIRQKKGMKIAEARKYVLESDMQRSKFRDFFRTKFSDEIYYNLRFNCKSFTAEEICELIARTAELEKLI